MSAQSFLGPSPLGPPLPHPAFKGRLFIVMFWVGLPQILVLIYSMVYSDPPFSILQISLTMAIIIDMLGVDVTLFHLMVKALDSHATRR